MTTAVNQQNMIQDVDIAIAGLGPTGLTLAHILGKKGLKVVVLEREPKFYGNARAVYTDDECMRVFQSIDAAQALQKDMLLDTPAQWVLPDGTMMAQYKLLKKPYGWPIISFFYQPYLETTLTDLLNRYPNVEVLRGRELTDFAQDRDGVTLTHQATQSFRFGDETDSRVEQQVNPDPQKIRARYLVGADGGRSIVREKLGIKMTGKNFPEPWLVVDLKLKEGVNEALHHIPYFNFYCDPECPAVSCPQPDGHHRFEFMLRKGQTKEYMEKDETVRMYLSKYVDPDKFIVKRKLVYTFNALMAERWRDGRIILAGDAAHMTPQFMGQGMSSGVRDAFNLGWKLEALIKGNASDQILDSYQKERQPHAQAMIDISVLMKDMVSVSNPLLAKVRNLAVKGLLVTPKVSQWLKEGRFKPSPVYPQGSYLGLPRAKSKGPEGAMAPQPKVRTLHGRPELLDDLVQGGFVLIGQNTDPRSGIEPQLASMLESLNTRFVTLYEYGTRPQGHTGVSQATPTGLIELEDLNGLMLDWFKEAGFKNNAVAIIRPDKFTFAVVQQSELNSALNNLKTQLGWLPSAIPQSTLSSKQAVNG